MMSTMSPLHNPSVRQRPRRRAIGLAEVLVSMLIISGLLVSALNTLGSVSTGRLGASDQARAHHFAEDLMSEILSQAYEEPVDAVLFGPEGAENTSTRSAYDDVDDYLAWSSTNAQRKDGVAIAGFEGWTRTVEVQWIQPSDLLSTALVASDVKRIIVTALKNGKVMATVTAIRTAGPPAMDAGQVCLFVVTDPEDPNAAEASRISLIESWGYTVTFVQDSDKQDKYDTVLADAAVVYVSTEIDPDNIGTKLTDATIGIVFEEPGLVPTLGFSGGIRRTTKAFTDVDDNTHAITAGFPTGYLRLFNSPQPVFTLRALVAPGIYPLTYTQASRWWAYVALSYLETGDTLYGGGAAAGRRVMLPWGDDGFDFSTLTDDAKTIMERSIEWAANDLTAAL